MELTTFIKAWGIGLSIAAPVGPIGLLCIQRTLQHGRKAGFVSGLGAASADAVYGAIGAFGLGVISKRFVELQGPLAVLGALFLIWLGAKLLRDTGTPKIQPPQPKAAHRPSAASSCSPSPTR